jgi:histidyl-tRNA synthetase
LLPVEDEKVDIFAVVHSLAIMLRMNALEFIEKSNTKRQFSVDMMWQGSLKKRLEKAAASNASYVIIIGKDEFDAEKCRIKNMDKRTETLISFEELKTPDFIEKLFGLEI